MSIGDLQRLVNWLDYDAAVKPFGDRFNLTASDRQLSLAEKCNSIFVTDVYRTQQISLTPGAVDFLMQLGLNALIERLLSHAKHGEYASYVEWLTSHIETGGQSTEAGLAIIGLLQDDFDQIYPEIVEDDWDESDSSDELVTF